MGGGGVIGILFEPGADGPLSAGPRVKWSIRRQLLLWQGASFCQVTPLFGWWEYLDSSNYVLFSRLHISNWKGAEGIQISDYVAEGHFILRDHLFCSWCG